MTPILKARVPADGAEAIARVLRSGEVGGVGKGSEVVVEFERALAVKLECAPDRLVTTNSGTSALLLALDLAGVRDGRVISSPMTFVATTTAIYQAGAEPLWADVVPGTCLIDPASVARRLSFWTGSPGRIDAIMAVAWGGFLPNLPRLRWLASRRKIPLILDAAQAFGARAPSGVPAHALADFTIYSFAPTKHLTTGDGGALVCRRVEDADRARRLAWFGMDRSGPRDQEIEAPGFKLHMNAIAAAMGLAGLEGLDDALAACRRNATIYRGALGGRDVLEGASPWTWTVFVENPADFIAYMHGHGVTVGQPHRRNDANDFAASTRRSLPGVDFAQAHYCSIPVGWWVDAAEAARIAGLVSAFPGLLRL